MDTITRGNAAEAAVLSELVQLGAQVLLPLGGGCAYDLMADLGGGVVVRVQCKAARRRGGCIVFNSRSTDHGRGRQSYAGRADMFGVHYAASGAVFLVPVSDCSGFEVNLRIEPTRNNQRKRVTPAADYESSSWTLERLAKYATAGGATAA